MPNTIYGKPLTYQDALEVIIAYDTHITTGHVGKPPEFKCAQEQIVNRLLEEPWPLDMAEEYFQGLFNMAVLVNVMWDEAKRYNKLLEVVGVDVDSNLVGMMTVLALKWKEARGRQGVDEVREFSGVEEIEI